MRIRGLDEETEEQLEDYEELKGKIADLTKTAKTPGGISLFTDETKTEFKSTYQFLKDISEVWNDITDKNQAALLEAIAGKRGAQSLSSILADFSEVERAMEEMEDAAGSADAEMDIIRDSISFKLNELKETWVGVLQKIIDRGDVGGIIDKLSGVSNYLGDIISKLGLVKSALIAIGTVLGTKLFNKIDFSSFKGVKGFFSNDIGKNKDNIEYLNRIQSTLTQTGTVTDTDIDSLRTGLNGLTNEAVNFAHQIKETNGAILEGKDCATAFVDTYKSGLKQLGSAVVGLGKSILSSLVKGLVAGTISYFLTDGISKLVTWIDKTVHASKYIQAEAKKAREEISKIKEELNKTVDTVDNVKKHYAELAQEVKSLGTINQSQGTLSNDEYKEFLDISNQLAELFPTLTQGYDKNGNAIINLSGDVDTIVGSLEKLVDIERQAANAKIAEEMPDVWAGYSNSLDKYTAKLKSAQEGLETINRLSNLNNLSGMQRVIGGYTSDNGDYYSEKYLKEAASIAKITLPNNLSNLTAENEKSLRSAFVVMKNNYTREISEYSASIKEQNKQVYDNMSSLLLDDAYVKNMTEHQQKLYQALLSNIDFSSFEESAIKSIDFNNLTFEGLKNLDETVFNNAFADIQSYLISIMNNTEGENAQLFDEYWDEIFSIDLSEGVYAENVEKIKEFFKKLAELLGLPSMFGDINGSILSNLFGFGDIDDKLNRAKGAFVKDFMSDDKNAFGFNEVDFDKVRIEENAEKVYDAFIDSLDVSDLDLWNEALDRGEIPPELLRQGESALKSYLKKLQGIASQNEIEIKASAAVDSMANMKSAVASLSDLYNQSVLQSASENADNFTTFAADPATLNSIESAFNEFSEKLKAEGNNDAVNVINDALDNFEKTAVEAFGDDDYAEQMQDAINRLITSYIDQTDVIKNLTEENKEWSVAQLEAMGITNALDVVEDRLTKVNQKLSKSYSKLTDSITAYKDAVSRNDEEAQQSSLEDITNELNSVYDYTDSKGNKIQVFDTEYVKANLEAISTAIENTTDKYDDLDKMASKQYIAKLKEEVDDTNLRAKFVWLEDAMMRLDGSQLEIGASMDDTEVIRALNNIYATGKYTVEEFQKMVSQISGGTISATPGWDWIDTGAEMEVPDFSNQHGWGSSSVTPKKVTVKLKQRLPKFTYEYKSKGSAGRLANYSAPSTSGSSGGGGGGGGSEPTQPKEESEETFDWIEVAIQRIEEEISRLDKVVGNSYDLWINRNEALVKEMEKTTEEIKAQQLAQSEYLRNANAVQVNNGKGLNDDDYGENDELVKANDQKLLDEARAAWATGEYQRKVREGQMSGDDIEKIQNHFLSETIQFYQELYNKSVAAGDAVQDLQIKLGELARTNFDHVKSEYEELIQYITDSADIINEKINRTEEHGYFVSKSYYQDLLKLESGNLAYLEGEYEDLIKKRDEAVAAGYIAESSSEWNQMNQEINAVNKSIEESKTKTVELNNAIRQLEWDRFDWLEDRISKINEEASFLVDLMSNDQLYEDNGKLTGMGHSTNAMYAVQYETYMRQARDYAEERKKLEKEMAADPANKNLVERYEDLVAAQQDAIKGAEQMKDAVKSLVEEGFNRFLSSLQKLIDEYKKAQTEAKDLYTYQQNIAEQTKNIGNLRKQLTAYAGDDSEETRATRQRLQTQLEDAEKKLQETQWDKYISETEKFLDDMYSDMEETLNARLDNIDLLMQDMINVANEHSALVNQTITEETEKVGYTLTEGVRAILNGGEGSLVTYINGVTNAVTNVSVVLETIKNLVASMVDNGKKTVEAESKATSTGKTTTTTAPTSNGGTGGKTSGTTTKTNTGKTNNTGSGTGSSSSTSGNSSTPKRTDEDYYGVALAIINGTLGWGNGDERFKKLKAKGFDDDKVMSIVNKLWNEGYVFSNAWVGRYYGIKDLSKYAYNKYAKGSKNITKDQLAWTQEKGQELIFRSSDGAMLTPLNAGDKVFTAQMTDNLWELAKGKFSTVPKSTGGNTINNSNAISITLPNVKNYEEFKTALQNDPKMTSFIQQITLGEVTNGVRLNKKKY